MKANLNRREFIALTAGAGAALLSCYGAGRHTRASAAVPRQEFGGSGVAISKLCLGGGSFLGVDSRALLDEALKHGVDCWETVSFTGSAYADYFSAHPGIRERVFLSGKVYSTDPADMQEQLEKALQQSGTSFMDFVAIHTVHDVAMLTDDVRRWAEQAKRDKKIRLFGFCTHKNMDSCLSAAAGLGWIDGIQTVYNYRLQSVPSMEEALQKCHDKGIGIFAIKSMGLSVQRRNELENLPLHAGTVSSLLAGHRLSFEQAKLKAIWQNPHVTSICSLMPTPSILQSNAAAATDARPLDAGARRLLAAYADGTGEHYCRRCGLCDAASADRIPIFDIMEMLMYSRAYEGMDWVAKRFTQIPIEIRSRIESSDYSAAERVCPQRMPIGRLMKEACIELGT